MVSLVSGIFSWSWSIPLAKFFIVQLNECIMSSIPHSDFFIIFFCIFSWYLLVVVVSFSLCNFHFWPLGFRLKYVNVKSKLVILNAFFFYFCSILFCCFNFFPSCCCCWLVGCLVSLLCFVTKGKSLNLGSMKENVP